MPNFDQAVTQWVAPSYCPDGSAWICSHVQVVGRSTSPSTVKVQPVTAMDGVGSACRTGHWSPASYCPGGSRESRARLPENPGVIGIGTASSYYMASCCRSLASGLLLSGLRSTTYPRSQGTSRRGGCPDPGNMRV